MTKRLGARGWGGVAVIAALIALVGGVVWATGRNEIAPPAHTSAVRQDDPIPLKKSRLATPDGARLRMAVVGDSYSPDGDTPAGRTWVDRLTEQVCLDIVERSAGGGYLADEKAAQGVPADIMTVKPQAVLVGAGATDYELPSQRIIGNANHTFKALRNAVGGDVAIIAIGPVAAPSADTKALGRAATAISYSARLFHVDFIDPLKGKWLDDPSMWAPDGIHFSELGSAEYVKRVSAELEHMGAGTCAQPSQG